MEQKKGTLPLPNNVQEDDKTKRLIKLIKNTETIHYSVDKRKTIKWNKITDTRYGYEKKNKLLREKSTRDKKGTSKKVIFRET